MLPFASIANHLQNVKEANWAPDQVVDQLADLLFDLPGLGGAALLYSCTDLVSKSRKLA